MKTNFESPVHTARDMVERNITLFKGPGASIWKELLSQSDNPEFRIIGENMIVPKSWSVYDALIRNEMLSQGTHARMSPYIQIRRLRMAKEIDPDQGVTIISTEYVTQKGEYKYNQGRGYYRGELVILAGVANGGGYLTNKKWHLNEVYLLLVELTKFKLMF